MTITLNQRSEELSGDNLTIQEVLAEKKFSFKMLVVKLNGELIPRDKREITRVKEGDVLQVIHLMSGG
jgi:sulfur carrier protein